eukprot:gene9325-biopygen40
MAPYGATRHHTARQGATRRHMASHGATRHHTACSATRHATRHALCSSMVGIEEIAPL